ncbi:hypothetical protein ACFO4N_14815 [Camelliibacillus cellulosilyticus]|uniref:Uncharacterized protein n=1 Tax=Camelliibacillus cellulosilyticus TaxID=2174486 RepID=A0ABV9GSQ4_9BACL
MIKKLLPILIVTLLALALVGIKIYPKIAPAISNHVASPKMPKQQPLNKDNPIKKPAHTQHKDITKEPTFPFAMKEDENLAKKYPDQFNIVNKMYYSWDFINNAQGECEWGNPGDETFHNRFYVDFVKGENFAISERLNKGKVVETETILFKDGVGIRELKEKKIYNKATRFPNDTPKHFKNEMMGRENAIVTNSEWFDLIYNNYPNWYYKESTAFGIPVYKIKGKYSPEPCLV